MNLKCSNDIIFDNLVLYIDITNLKSWNLNTGLTVTSMTQWDKAVSSDITLPDFGLTAFDNGRVDDMNAVLNLNTDNIKPILYRVGENIGDINNFFTTSYTFYDINPNINDTVGNYFDLNGGYLQGFFKLEDYNFEILPYRYNNGVTFESLMKINTDDVVDEDIFLYLGVRAEDKYNPSFSGECITIKTGNETEFSGYTTSEGNYLNAYMEVETLKKAINNLDEMYENTLQIADPDEDLNNNIIAFYLTPDKEIGVKYVNEKGDIVRNVSNKDVIMNGWSLISITFEPYEQIPLNKLEILSCYPRRKGTLKFYQNSNIVYKIEEFDEFYFRGLNNHKEKQLGVPYNISWGGGSFGLKHSWHYNELGEIVKNSEEEIRKIEQNFNTSFIGAIQKLRMYNRSLNSREILNNVKIDFMNSNYDVTINKGGRIIFK